MPVEERARLQEVKQARRLKELEAGIQKSAEKMPLTVGGNVAWVAAQSAPIHIRLTLLDSGGINPSDKTAEVKFQGIGRRKNDRSAQWRNLRPFRFLQRSG